MYPRAMQHGIAQFIDPGHSPGLRLSASAFGLELICCRNVYRSNLIAPVPRVSLSAYKYTPILPLSQCVVIKLGTSPLFTSSMVSMHIMPSMLYRNVHLDYYYNSRTRIQYCYAVRRSTQLVFMKSPLFANTGEEALLNCKDDNTAQGELTIRTNALQSLGRLSA